MPSKYQIGITIQANGRRATITGYCRPTAPEPITVYFDYACDFSGSGSYANSNELTFTSNGSSTVRKTINAPSGKNFSGGRITSAYCEPESINGIPVVLDY